MKSHGYFLPNYGPFISNMVLSAYRDFHHLQAGRGGNTLVQPGRAPCEKERKIYKSIFHQAAVATVRNQHLPCAPGMEQESKLVQRRKVTHLQNKMHRICTKHIYCTRDQVSLFFLLSTSLWLAHNTEPKHAKVWEPKWKTSMKKPNRIFLNPSGFPTTHRLTGIGTG